MTKIDRHVMQAHGEKTEAEQQRQVLKPGQADAFSQRDQRHERRRQQKSQQGQMSGVVRLQAEMNTGRGVTPARHDKRHGQDDFEGRGGGCERLHGRAPVDRCIEYQNSDRSPQLTYTALTVHFG